MEHQKRHHRVGAIVILAAVATGAPVTISATPRAWIADQPALAHPARPMITASARRVESPTPILPDFSATVGSDDEDPASASAGYSVTPPAVARPRVDGLLSRPHVLVTDVADVMVRVRGGATCTGTPITGTTLVLTAAHCVLDDDGEVSGTRTVLRDGVSYTAVSVLVDPRYHDSPGPLRDAAVLVMEQEIPGPSATLADTFPTQETVTVAGFQPLDTDGSLLRGTRYDNRPDPKGAAGGVVHIDSAAAGCVHLPADLQITTTQVKVPCGLIPGASGGGLFVEQDGGTIIVGIISTVATDLAYNGVVPLTAVHQLLEHPAEYTHEMPDRASTLPTARFTPS